MKWKYYDVTVMSLAAVYRFHITVTSMRTIPMYIRSESMELANKFVLILVCHTDTICKWSFSYKDRLGTVNITQFNEKRSGIHSCNDWDRTYMRTEHTSLQWHHNEHDGVPDYRRLDFTQPFVQVQIKANITSLAFVRGIHRGPVNSPHKEPITRKMFLFGDAIMCVQIKYIYIHNQILNSEKTAHTAILRANHDDHQMETFSALLALCAGNSPVTGEFCSQGPVAGSFGVFFDLRLNKQLSKQSRRKWFETPSRPLISVMELWVVVFVSSWEKTDPVLMTPHWIMIINLKQFAFREFF